MPPHDTPQPADRFAENFTRIAQASQAVMQEFMARNNAQKGEYLGTQFATAYLDYLSQAARNPQKLLAQQMAWWQEYLKLLQHSAKRLTGETQAPYIEPESKDRRFKDEAWRDNALFDFIKQSYLLTARWMLESARDTEGLDPHQSKKLDFYTRQFVDAMSPSNFLMTNPEVLRATLESGGENLVNGLSNLLEDLERSKGALRVSMTDMDAFEVGRNLATTPGKVVYENELMQLIQYAPVTQKVHKAPLLIIPAWINKYYILDLQPDNSFVAWALEQGYTVFMVSWVNPDERLAQKTFEDYLALGPLAALDAIERATGEKQVAAIGYCLGGTLLSIALAYLAAKKQSSRILSATFLTTMVDFSDAGELSVFIDDAQLQALEGRMAERGYLEGEEMAGTFNLLRANDLVWSFVVNNYLLGKDPFPFDLLYWNADSTRMPAMMHSFYLRAMYQQNRLVQPGALTLLGTPIDLRRINVPCYILSAREDHIAPWKSTYQATQIYRGDVTFVLAASGHIAGVVNAPKKNKYMHWVSDTLPPRGEDWLARAKEEAGSWWPHWNRWQEAKTGTRVKARQPGDGKLKPVEDAPGRYAKTKS